MESGVTNRIWGRNKTASFLLEARPKRPLPPPRSSASSAADLLLHCLNHMSEGACDWTLAPQMTAVIAPSSQTRIK